MGVHLSVALPAILRFLELSPRIERQNSGGRSMEHLRRIHRVMLVTMVLSGACAQGEADELEGDMAFREGEGGGDEGIIVPPGHDPEAGADDGGGGGRTGGDWIINGLAEPSVSGVDPAFALDSSQGLGEEGWLAEGDPAGEKVIRYLVQCALNEGDSVTVAAPSGQLVFGGHLGLAPEWRDGPCDESCQEWVSACLLARTNETETETMLFVQGDHAQLGFGTDPDFTFFEGTFFGNVFLDPASMHACRGHASAMALAEQQGRTCTQSESECGFTTYDNCANDAGCEHGPSGVATIDCQPDPEGPIYPGISVHLADL